MIDKQIKVHDKFSAEIKVGFFTHKDKKVNKSALNIWMFIPNSLDINRYTYDKKDFYRDMKSNIRLITPICLLKDIAEGTNSPFLLLQKSVEHLLREPNHSNREDYEYHIKMFMSILKSSLREELATIKDSEVEKSVEMIEEYTRLLGIITFKYRSLFHLINIPRIEKQLCEYFNFGDEFMSNLMNFHSFSLMKNLKKHSEYEIIKATLYNHINNEIAYKKEKGYLIIKKDDKHANSELVNRLSHLKKYIESQLFINVAKQKDGVLVEQLLLSLAAGISMIFATGVAFSIQQKYGSFTMPLFVALVISYMLKDRIKEFSRYYFAHKMGTHYFDHKTNMSIKQTDIGWVKESMDFISEDNIPPEILKTRASTSIIEANNRANSEKVLLYRTVMQIDSEKLNLHGKFVTKGVNAIIRFNFLEFIRNMDNPEFPLYKLEPDQGFEIVDGRRLYYINFVVQRISGEQNELDRYRVAINPNGIYKIERIEMS